MQYRIASTDQLVDAAPIGEIATDPRNTCARFAARARQRADRVTGMNEMFEQVSANETGRARDRNATDALAYFRCARLRQEPVPPAARETSALSSDAAYMRRACERDGLPDEVRGNACASTSSTWQWMPNSVLMCACTV
jgi:hypothetical protein